MERLDEIPHYYQKTVSIGGGTGQYSLLTGLRLFNCPSMITAVAGTWDDGHDSGRLRVDEGVLPPGDARQCLVALSKPGRQRRAMEPLFGRRNSHGESMGNRIITFYMDWAHGDQDGLDCTRDLLLMKSKVLFVTRQDLTLYAKTQSGVTVEGESRIDERHKKEGFDPNDKIISIYFDTSAEANPQVLQAIEEADKIIIPSGSLYGSLLPHLLVEGIQKSIVNSKARLIFVLNLMTEVGQTDNFKASDHLGPFLDYLDCPERLNYLIVNENHLDPKVETKYREEGQIPVELDEEACQKLAPRMQIIRQPVASYTRRRDLFRHDHRLAQVILELP